MLSGINLHFPVNLDEALNLLEEKKGALILAGGTDLLVDLKQGLIEARELVSLQKIDELKAIEKDKDRITLGALLTPEQIVASSLIDDYLPAVGEAARSMASPQVRRLATLGGNISSAVPSADLPPPLIAAGARIELLSTRGKREINLIDYFTGPRETDRRADELLARIHVPLPLPGTGASFHKFALREANALAVASAAASLRIAGDKILEAHIVLGAVSPTPIIASRASEFLSGKKPSTENFEKAASTAREECKPISDIRGSAWFRRELVSVLARRALAEALLRAKSKEGKNR